MTSPNAALELITTEGFGRDAKVPACPACGGRMVKNGRARGSQRYVCRSCGKTIGITHGSPFYRTKTPLSVWNKFLLCVESRTSLRKAAALCGISLPTASRWRRHYLDYLARVHFRAHSDRGLCDEKIDEYLVELGKIYRGKSRKTMQP